MLLLLAEIGTSGSCHCLAALRGRPSRGFSWERRFRKAQRASLQTGVFVVYVSNETGKSEIYVRPFSPDGTPGGQQMISVGGGLQPLWRRDGKEIIYIAPDSKVMAVP